PEVDAAQIAALQTLRDVLGFMETYRDQLEAQGGRPQAAGPAGVEPASPAPRTTAEIMAARMGKMAGATGATAGGSTSDSLKKLLDADLETMLFDVVAQKTGYPREILNLEMSLEADL